MQFDSQRAFPYPVLRPGVNDYLDGEFQTIIEFGQNQDNSQIDFEVQFALSIDEIREQIEIGCAKYVAIISCRDTYFRKAFSATSPQLSYKVLSSALKGEVQVYSYVFADRDIDNFTCDLINPEFGKGPFRFETGSILAADEPKAVFIDRETFRPITSVFELVKNDNLPHAEWHLDVSQDRVQIIVGPLMKEKIDRYRNSSKNKAILLNSLYFSAVMQCVSHLKNGEGEYDCLRWADILRQQCHNMNIDLDNHCEYIITEKLLKLPLKLMDTYVFQEGQE